MRTVAYPVRDMHIKFAGQSLQLGDIVCFDHRNNIWAATSNNTLDLGKPFLTAQLDVVRKEAVAH